MNGADHFQQAERLLRQADNNSTPADRRSGLVEFAKVHAILAVAAALKEGDAIAGQWDQVLFQSPPIYPDPEGATA